MKVRLAIKELAQARGYNQSRLQLKAQVSAQVMNRYWNNNVESITLDLLSQIAEALGVEPGELLVRDQDSLR